MCYVYILLLKTGEFYKGIANDLSIRLLDHSKGNVKATKGKLPLRLVHVEMCGSKREARQLEKFFKSGFGREIIQEIFKN
ncbi:GIY-YIG nuclease family protein [Candidatus Microgenomates bacterium]|nr:GIY-YIG nuclease family protein [Candidatus Microgenomates bacterium]MBI4098323.1 GIY-YIG nuclease family protein [Candidatus Levybacteria bacterium]